MRPNVYIAQTNCITPLGFDVSSNVGQILQGNSGIRRHENRDLLPVPFQSAIIDTDALDVAFSKIADATQYTKLEKMIILALHPLVTSVDLDAKTAFILSTTKGNITALEEAGNPIEKAQLQTLAKTVAGFFGFEAEPIVVSNACVSGILAVSVAKRMIQAGAYEQAFVVAGDLVSAFVLSGFHSFQAMSDAPCKPYSATRNGVNLGEAAAAVKLTTIAKEAQAAITGEGSINDANHISGPSRTGEGLYLSIKSAMKEAGITAHDIDYISAHGTATPFNDEMEAIAFNRMGMQNIPLNSLKGYYGHTLGASGLLETVLALESMRRDILFASLGFDELGVSEPIAVLSGHTSNPVDCVLKTASGFGGCNTAVILKKVNA